MSGSKPQRFAPGRTGTSPEPTLADIPRMRFPSPRPSPSGRGRINARDGTGCNPWDLAVSADPFPSPWGEGQGEGIQTADLSSTPVPHLNLKRCEPSGKAGGIL